MNDAQTSPYATLDRPEVLARLFHPRPEFLASPPPDAVDLAIPVAEGVALGARLHAAGPDDPVVLFFHGNGEIVADYDDLGPFYNRLGLSFLPVDYRGYGRSGGRPTVSAMMQDCHAVFRFAQDWLAGKGHTGPLAVMGRSLGSASALELAAGYPDRIAGLILESAFAYATPLLRVLGIDPEALGFEEGEGFRNIDKIKKFAGPTLIIHGEYDHIIPLSDGQALYEASPAPDKTLLKIPGANHNDLIMVGFTDYMAAIRDLRPRLQGGKPLAGKNRQNRLED
jgi:pimeloyl-ACP methyl ester carboxylesterase